MAEKAQSSAGKLAGDIVACLTPAPLFCILLAGNFAGEYDSLNATRP